ncbi:unnamed protein product [Pedinophyceae sp. YPF-701]|nr:unnamed protein product [Pedinophyceae sp. YPF-701]
MPRSRHHLSVLRARRGRPTLDFPRWFRQLRTHPAFVLPDIVMFRRRNAAADRVAPQAARHEIERRDAQDSASDTSSDADEGPAQLARRDHSGSRSPSHDAPAARQPAPQQVVVISDDEDDAPAAPADLLGDLTQRLQHLRTSSRAREASRPSTARPRAPASLRIGPETDEEVEAKRQLHSKGAGTEVLLRCPAAELRRVDFRALRGEEWLTDEVVNFYLYLVQRRNDEEWERAGSPQRRGASGDGDGGRPHSGRRRRKNRTKAAARRRVHVMSSFFYTQLACGKRGYDYAAVKRWTLRVAGPAPLARDLILIPINHNNLHWTLAAVLPREGRVLYLDSMQGGGLSGAAAPHRVERALLRWVEDEARDKDLPAPPEPWRFEVVAPLPQQRDGGSCGVFACVFAERLAAGLDARELVDSFAQADMPRLRVGVAADLLAQGLRW